MSRTLAIIFFAVICTAAAFPRGLRATRDVTASTCSYMSCAVKDGNCGLVGSTLQFCTSGQHCGSGNKCMDNKALGAACDSNAPENECAQGSCVNSVCQFFQEILPGNPCTEDSQCYYNDGTSSTFGSTCDKSSGTGLCKGQKLNEACSASHQCFVGLFCKPSTMTCQSLGQKGDSCNNDTECGARFTCFNKQCSSRYSQAQGQSCQTSDNCQAGLYCKAGTCASAKTSSASGNKCDVSANACPTDEECACQGFTTSSQSATCSNIQGTFSDMQNIETNAYNCMDKNGCGSDLSNSTSLSCISSKCEKEFCTFFSRYNNDLYTDFPMCLVSRMVGNTDYYNLINKCSSYKPTGETQNPGSSSTTGQQSSASSVYLSLSVAAVVVISYLF